MQHTHLTHLTLLTSKLFDPVELKVLENKAIVVDTETGFIVDVKSADGTEQGSDIIDLRGAFVIPGLVDAHTHIFLHPYTEAPWTEQVTVESLTERIARATVHARDTLASGYTTIRDLGTEGAFDCDIELRDAINKGVIVGPRIFAASRAIASTGGYQPKTTASLNGVSFPHGAEIADGEDEVRKVVRRQLGAGADVIKLYADYPRRTTLRPPVSSQLATESYPLFQPNELRAAVEEAGLVRTKVAIHAKGPKAVQWGIQAGVHSVEHGNDLTRRELQMMKKANVVFVPTLAVYEASYRHTPSKAGDWQKTVSVFQMALEEGVTLAAGGDTGTFRHGDNVREVELMIEYGMDILKALSCATWEGYRLLRPISPDDMHDSAPTDHAGFGRIAPGFLADIVALGDDPRNGLEYLRNVKFVMKGGKVFKHEQLIR